MQHECSSSLYKVLIEEAVTNMASLVLWKVRLHHHNQLILKGNVEVTMDIILFVSSGSAPSFPASFGTAQTFLSNPMVTGAAVQYGQGLVNMGQSYIDQTVRENKNKL